MKILFKSLIKPKHSDIYGEAIKAKQLKYESIQHNVETAYKKSCEYFSKPTQTHEIRKLCFSSLNDILTAQSTDDLWGSSAYMCDCWIGTDSLLGCQCLYILDSKEHIESMAKNLPDYFNSVDMAFHQIFRLMIPVDDIRSYSVIGNTFSTQKISGGDPGHFIGVSVNGIGFGEFVGSTPIQISNNIHDRRFIALTFRDYRDELNGDISTLFFTFDSLGTLLELIPLKFNT